MSLPIVYNMSDEWETIWPVEVKLETEDTTICSSSETLAEKDITPIEPNQKCKKKNDASKEYECFDCDFHSSHLSRLKSHIKNDHLFLKVSPCSLKFFLKCSEYGYKTSFMSALTKHIAKKPDSPNVLSCKLCEYRTPYKNRLEQHMKKHTNLKLHTCEVCGRAVSSSSDLKKHKRVHTGEKPFTCSLCDYSAASSSSLRMHLSKHTGERPYACEHCDYKTARRGDLSSHMLSHSKEKPYVCPCGFKTARPAHLKRHMAIHNGNRPYGCNYCDSYFTRSDDLKKHIKIHTNERNYHCPYCDYRAKLQNALQRHLRRKHFGNEKIKPVATKDGTNIPLPQCDKKASTAYTTSNKKKSVISEEISLVERNHFLYTHENQSYVCFHCGHRSGHLKSLRGHIISEHEGGNWKQTSKV